MARKYENTYLLLIIALASLLQTLVLYVMPISISNDSYGYLSLASNLTSDSVAFERSIGYPLLLALAGVQYFDTLILIVYIQCLMAIFMPVMIFYAVRPLGFFYSILASLIMLSFLFAFHMANQILTELPYMFSLSLFALACSRYFHNRNYSNVFFVVLSLIFVASIRMSSDVQFIGFVLGSLVLLFTDYFLNGEIKKRALVSLLIGVAVFSSAHVANNMLWDRNASTATPHYMWNWVYKKGSSIQYGIVHPDNGPVSLELFQTLEKIVSDEPAVFKFLAAGGSQHIQDIASSKDTFARSDVEAMMFDLTYYTGHDFRSWWIEGVLNNRLGIPETARLLGGAIKEAFTANPGVLISRTFTVFERVKSYFLNGVVANPVLLPSAYFHQIPHDFNFNPVLQKGIFAEWMSGMTSQVGSSIKGRDELGGFPSNWTDARTELREHNNFIAFGHYLIVHSLQIIRPVWVLLLFGVLFFLWSPNIGFAVAMISVAVATPFLSVFISETDPRHLIMSFPLQVVGGMLGLCSFTRFFSKYLLRRQVLHASHPNVSFKSSGMATTYRYSWLNWCWSTFNLSKIRIGALLVFLAGSSLIVMASTFVFEIVQNNQSKGLTTISSRSTDLLQIWTVQNGVLVRKIRNGDIDNNGNAAIAINETPSDGEHFVGTSQFELSDNSKIKVELVLNGGLKNPLLIYFVSDKGVAYVNFDLVKSKVSNAYGSENINVAEASINKVASGQTLAVEFDVYDKRGFGYLRLQFSRKQSQSFVGDSGSGLVMTQATYIVDNQ